MHKVCILNNSMGQSGCLMIFLYPDYEVNEAENRSYIHPLPVEFFQSNGTSSISVILLTNGQTDGRTNGHEFNTSLAEVKILDRKSHTCHGSSHFLKKLHLVCNW